MSPVRARTRAARCGEDHTIHEAPAPPIIRKRGKLSCMRVTIGFVWTFWMDNKVALFFSQSRSVKIQNQRNCKSMTILKWELLYGVPNVWSWNRNAAANLTLFPGEFCEVRMEIPCRDKFFSASSIGVCGPCQCAVGMNLSPVCNKSTGECYCNVRTKDFRD